MAKKTKDNVNIDEVDVDDLSDNTEKKRKKDKKKKNGKKRRPFLTLIIILFVLAVIFIVSVVLDLFGLRTNYLGDFFANIPIVGDYIGDETRPSYEDLENNYNNLQKENENIKSSNDDLQNTINDLTAENQRLKEFESNQISFSQDKLEFDTMIANEDPDDFTQFYESMNPETAEEIYNQFVQAEISQTDLDEYVARYQNMKESDAAAIFEELMITNIDLVTLILENLDSDTAGNIISSMTPENGATITRNMAPTNN